MINKIGTKRQFDYQIISDWVALDSKVLDLGCGQGLLLEKLNKERNAYTVGVDTDPAKVGSCIQKSIPVYQGDIFDLLKECPDQSFDWVICSRTAHELVEPAKVLLEALRVGRHLVIGFVNNAFWLNRLNMLWHGRRIINEVYPDLWYKDRPTNAVSISDFEQFCQDNAVRINRRFCLDGSWRKPCYFLPKWFAGYVLYELSR